MLLGNIITYFHANIDYIIRTRAKNNDTESKQCRSHLQPLPFPHKKGEKKKKKNSLCSVCCIPFSIHSPQTVSLPAPPTYNSLAISVHFEIHWSLGACTRQQRCKFTRTVPTSPYYLDWRMIQLATNLI